MSIGCKLLFHTKVKASRGVDSKVSGTHCCKYFPHGADVLLHTELLNGVSFGGENPGAHPLHKYLYERD